MGKQIAILCMSLNIGGAETHIYELARGLTAKGHKVTLFSNGGVYAEALEQEAIRHIRTPLHKKSLSAMWTSYRTLLREFKRNRPSVVHSHTRISNFIGGLVCKKLGIPMVTTVHGRFKVNRLFRLFSNWGCRALAVSEDLRQYLIENYRFNPDHVSLTVNGIDMNRFSKGSDDTFRSSLRINPEEKMILMVSRLDKDPSAHVEKVLRLAPEIYKGCPQCRIVVVGSGDYFNTLTQLAEEINRQCEKEIILLQGARTDIERYTGSADLFVGISRSALEAMSSSVPTILLGNHGYLGLYSNTIQKECIETNLTCRGYPFPSDKEITELIINCLQGRDLSENIREGLQLVRERFSLDTMASTADALYKSAIDSVRPYDYMIGGYYGSDNFGDNLTLRCLMDHLKNKTGSVLSHNIESTRVPNHVQKIHRFNLPAIYKQMKQTKVFLLGSGSLLQDTTSNRSLFYYLFIIKIALHCRCKTLLYANGIGPITRAGNKRRTDVLLKKIDFITVRDKASLDYLHSLGITDTAVLTADDAFSVDYAEHTAPFQNPIDEQKIIVGVNFKLGVAESPYLLKEIADALTVLAERYHLFYHLIPFHLSQDQPQLKALHQLIPSISLLVEPTADPQQIIRYLSAAKYQILERLHGQIMATMLGTPFLPINYDPKNHSLTEQIGLTDYALNHDQLSKEQIVRQFSALLENEDAVRIRLANYTEEAQKSAALNHYHLHKMIESY